MMGKNKGATLFQYIIIIVLIGLALVPVLMIFGNQIKTGLTNIVNTQSDINQQMQANSPESLNKIKSGTLKGGDLGGTPDIPVQACLKTVCSIDYGTFVLNGVPADFGSVVEASGTSGGSNEVAKIAEEIAQILENQGNTTGSEEFKQFANLVYFQAMFKKSAEDKAKTCISSSPPIPPVGCYAAEYNGNPSNITLPANLTTILPDYNPSPPLSPPLFLSTVNNYVRNDYARNIQNTNPADFATYKTQYPSFAMVELYNNIQNQTNTTYSPEIRTITNRLYQVISDVSFESSLVAGALGSNGSNNTLEKYDLFTGASMGTITTTSKDNMDDIVNPKFGANIDLRGSLLCGTGHNLSNGYECN